MELNCTPCMKNIEAQLSDLPSAWRDQIAAFVCNSILEANLLVNCDKVKECETVTSLGNFEVDTVDGSQVCIKYTDELGVEVNRCFDFEDVINSSLDNVDPQCLMTMEAWQSASLTEKWESIIEKVCTECGAETTTTTTTTTSTTTTTTSTTTTTTAAPLACNEFEGHNPIETDENNKFTYTPCGGSVPVDVDVPAGETITVCAEASPEPFWEACPSCTVANNGECIAGLFTIQNNSLSLVVTIDSVTPGIFVQTGGDNFTLANGETMNAEHYGFINTAFTVEIGNTSGSALGVTIAIRIYKNGVLQECQQTGVTGDYLFAAFDALPTDSILIIVDRTPC